VVYARRSPRFHVKRSLVLGATVAEVSRETVAGVRGATVAEVSRETVAGA